MRSIPGMVVLNPADHYEMQAAVKAAAAVCGPGVHPPGPSGCGERSTTTTITSLSWARASPCGTARTSPSSPPACWCSEAVKAAKSLEAAGIDARVIDIHTIKPLDQELVLKAAKETGRIVVAEEHNVIGGLGEAVASYLSEVYPTPVTKIGVNDTFGHSGPAVDLLKEFGLSAENIEATVKRVLDK